MALISRTFFAHLHGVNPPFRLRAAPNVHSKGEPSLWTGAPGVAPPIRKGRVSEDGRGTLHPVGRRVYYSSVNLQRKKPKVRNGGELA